MTQSNTTARATSAFRLEPITLLTSAQLFGLCSHKWALTVQPVLLVRRALQELKDQPAQLGQLGLPVRRALPVLKDQLELLGQLARPDQSVPLDQWARQD